MEVWPANKVYSDVVLDAKATSQNHLYRTCPVATAVFAPCFPPANVSLGTGRGKQVRHWLVSCRPNVTNHVTCFGLQDTSRQFMLASEHARAQTRATHKRRIKFTGCQSPCRTKESLTQETTTIVQHSRQSSLILRATCAPNHMI